MMPLVVANWKMNPATEPEALDLFERIFAVAKSAANIAVAVAPPFPFLEPIARRWNILDAERQGRAVVHLAAQDVFWEQDGAYTGEVSPLMEKNLGITYVIVGHSERRRFLGETDQMVNRKIKKALEFNIRPLLCIGEEKRAAGGIPESVGDELRAALDGVSASSAESIVVAYEPVWAISGSQSSQADTPYDMRGAALYIRKVLSGLYGPESAGKITILYGGSVSSENAVSFLAETAGEVGGLLVGRNSLTPDLTKIIEKLSRYLSS